MTQLRRQTGCQRAGTVLRYRLATGNRHFECDGFRDHGIQYSRTKELPELALVLLMNDQPTIAARHQVTEQLKAGIQATGLFNPLMNEPQTLRAEVFRRNRDDNLVGGQHRIPTALIQVWRAVDQHHVVRGQFRQELVDGELL